MFLLIAAAIVIILIVYVMVMPVTILVDTDEDLCKVFQPGVFSFQVSRKQKLTIEILIAGIRIPARSGKSAEQGTRSIKVKERSKRKVHSLSAWLFLMKRIIHSFRVHRFELHIDTGDFKLNAQLFPLLHFASHGKYSMNVNFVQRNQFAFTGSVRPISLLWAYVLFQTKQ